MFYSDCVILTPFPRIRWKKLSTENLFLCIRSQHSLLLEHTGLRASFVSLLLFLLFLIVVTLSKILGEKEKLLALNKLFVFSAVLLVPSVCLCEEFLSKVLHLRNHNFFNCLFRDWINWEKKPFQLLCLLQVRNCRGPDTELWWLERELA